MHLQSPNRPSAGPGAGEGAAVGWPPLAPDMADTPWSQQPIESRARPLPTRVTFKARIPRWQLQSAARAIQNVARRRIRQRLYDAVEQGRIFQPKHAASALDGAAVFVQAAFRRQRAVRVRKDLADERAVDEYNRARRQKKFTFKPHHPPSYYRASAALIQTRYRALKANDQERAVAVRRWETVRRHYGKSGARAAIRALSAPPIVFKPRMCQADAQRVKGMRSSSRGGKLVAGQGRAATTAPDASTSAQYATNEVAPAATGAASSAVHAPAPAAALMVAEAALAVPEWADATAERQQHAESAFMLADTSGDGIVDEGELIALLVRLLQVDDITKVAAFVQQFRPGDGTDISLDFDDFVDVFNTFSAARERGEI